MEDKHIVPLKKEEFYQQNIPPSNIDEILSFRKSEIFYSAILYKNKKVLGNGKDVMLNHNILKAFNQYVIKVSSHETPNDKVNVDPFWYEKLQSIDDSIPGEPKLHNNIEFNKRIKFVNLKHNILFDIIKSSPPNQLTLEKILSMYRLKDKTQRFGKNTLRKVIKRKLNGTYKVQVLTHRDTHTQQHKDTKLILFRKIIEVLLQGGEIIYIDECGFNNNKQKIKNWSFSFSNNLVVKKLRLKRINLIAAISSNSILLSNISLFNTNDKKVINFIQNLIKRVSADPYLHQKYENGLIHLFLDNAKFHHSEFFRREILRTRFNVIYNVSYSPQLNPIENVFSILKFQFRKKVFESE